MADFIGDSGNNVLNGTSLTDYMAGGGGNDTLNGGGGINDIADWVLLSTTTGVLGRTAVAGGVLHITLDGVNIFRVTLQGSTAIVEDLRSGSPLGTDTVTDVDNLQFRIPGTTNPQFVSIQLGVNFDGSTITSGLLDSTIDVSTITSSPGVVLAGAGNDTIIGSALNDVILGGAGNDLIFGLDGNDALLHGGEGDDRIFGGLGADFIREDVGNDVIDGGPSSGDILSYDFVMRGLTGTLTKATDGAGVTTIFLDGAPIYQLQRASDNWTQVTDLVRSQVDLVKNVGDVRFAISGPAPQFTALSFQSIDIGYVPTGVSISNATIKENSRIGTGIGTFSAADPDSTGTHTFTLLDNAAGRFAISGNTLVVANRALLDYEQQRFHDVVVRATDERGFYHDQTVRIAVANVNPEVSVGSSANDILFGGSGADRLSGLAGADLLNGGAGKDILNGGAGNDRLIGSTGRDVMTGGFGRDVFVFNDRHSGASKTSADYITDFRGRAGDRLDVDLVDANTGRRGDQDFTFIGQAAFTKAGQIRYEKTGTDTWVYLNTDADLQAEMVIRLKGPMDLSKGYFLL